MTTHQKQQTSRHRSHLQDKATLKDYLIAVLALIAVVGIVAYLLWRFAPLKFLQGQDEGQTEYEKLINKKLVDMSCVTKTTSMKPSENYLAPRIKTPAVNVMMNYYNCNPVKRDEAVLYYNAGEGNLGVQIKAIPDDSIRLEESKEVKDMWNVVVNNQIVTNSEKKPYILNQKMFSILSEYIKEFHGIVPERAVLGLFDNPEVTLLPGFISYTDFVGKIKELK